MAAPTGKVRLAIDFSTPDALIEFVDWLKSTDERYSDADAFAQDGLDLGKESGITAGNTYLLKNARDRLPRSALRERLARTRVRKKVGV